MSAPTTAAVASTAMYRFALRPKWILSHLAVLALIVTMVLLAAWQVRRLHDKQDRNALIESNSTGPASGVEALSGDPGTTQFRSVRVTGTYDAEREVAIRNHSDAAGPGRWIVTPLRLAGGDDVVLVLRGFLPAVNDDLRPPFDGVAPPAGEVTVEGWAQPTQTRDGLGPTDPPEGVLTEMARVDVARIAQQLEASVEPMWIQASTRQTADPGAPLAPVALPTPDEGPHFGYAVQWAIFTLIAIGGYPLILRKVARQKAAERRGEQRDAALGTADGAGGGAGTPEASRDAETVA